PELPTILTIKRNPYNIGLLANERPVQQWQVARARLFKEAGRGEHARRLAPHFSADVGDVPLDTDPDNLALEKHCHAIGVPFDTVKHWTELKDDLLSESQRLTKLMT